MAFSIPELDRASFNILSAGYVGDRVASTVALVQDGDSLIVIDPGMVADQSRILAPLAQAGVAPDQVTDVILSHHHPDHTINAGLFPDAWVHDHWARYRRDVWESRPADGYEISSSVRLLATPGHTREDITTLVGTVHGIVAFTHLWWHADGPQEDPLAQDPEALHHHRARVLEVASLIVPGHGAAFVPGDTTPR